MILAGGFGTRISEESSVRPKPMVEIGGMPILWHVMKIYASHGITDFIICCGYKGHMIKQWFANYELRHADVTFDLASGTRTLHRNGIEPWTVTLADTGEDTMTGGRVKAASKYLDKDQPFLLTYGDGVGDIDISATLSFHREHGRLATMTAVQPEGRFGAFTLAADQPLVTSFSEKPKGDGAWVNGGFFVLNPGVIDYIQDSSTVWEQEPLKQLASDGEIAAYRHKGFWMPMDTLRDRNVLEEHWNRGAPWKTW